MQIVSQRSVFDENPGEFRDKYEQTQNALTAKIVEARQRLKQVCGVLLGVQGGGGREQLRGGGGRTRPRTGRRGATQPLRVVCGSSMQADVPYDFRVKISQICSDLNVDGIRGDIVTNRAAKALAAFEGRTEVTPEDIYRVIPLCLRHRLRKDPLADIDSGDKVREVFKQVFGLE